MLHTDRLLAVLRPKLRRSGNPGAQERFAEALDREREARDAFHQSLYARAGRLTREARTLAREASVMVGPPEDDPFYVERSIKGAEDALSLAEDVLEQGASRHLWSRYVSLKGDVEDARALFRDRKTRLAYARAVRVRDGVLDLLRETEDLPVAAETASKAIRRAERAAERAGQELGSKPNAPAERWRREALAQLSKARVAYARKDYRDAVIHAKLVERNLDQAVAAQRAPAASAS